jgi:hypothetical protein
LNLVILFIYLYCVYSNVLNWKINIIVIFMFISIKFKLNFILNNFYLGYYKIHPPMLYYSLVLFFYIKLFSKKFFKISVILIIIILFITFILGSLWSLSQSIWGKYWSNDSIEIILLLLFIIGSVYLHQLIHTKTTYNFFILIQTLLILVLLRLNYIYTKHNFFQRSIKYERYLYLIYIFIISYIYKKTLIKLLHKINNIWKFMFYYFIFQIILNFVNINNIKLFNTWYLLVFINFYILLIISITSYYLFHLTLILILIVFNNYYINYIKYVYYTNYKNNYVLNYFKYKKNDLLYLFIKNKLNNNNNLFFNNSYNLIKIKNLNLIKNLNKTYMINYF